MASDEISLDVGKSEEKAVAWDRGTNSEATMEKSIMKEERGSSRKGSPIQKTYDPQESFLRMWKKIFVASCVFAVLLDPLFLYVPMMKDDIKCLMSDRNLKIAALLLRSVTDLFYIFDIFFQIYKSDIFSGSIDEYRHRGRRHYYSKIRFCGNYVVPTLAKTIWTSYNIIIDILAILPLPQVAILIFFSEMRDLRNLNTIRMVIMNLLVLLQYVPRVLRIYLSCKELKRTPKAETGETAKWVKCVLNFFMYILASHVLGAIWYFFAIQRMAICWRDACRKANGCNTSTFGCHDRHTFRNITFLNALCPISQVNTTLFDFGIYITVLQSGIPGSTSYFPKFSNCFWWGLQNLSSLGSNLAPSIDGWENLFAAFISIIGLLLFLYLIGNVQTYMQLDTTRIESIRHKWKVARKMQEKGRDTDLWLSKNGIPEKLKRDMKSQIMDRVQQEVEENGNADLDNIHSILPLHLQNVIKRHTPNTRLKQVPKFQDMYERVFKAICGHLKPMKYTKNEIIIREGATLRMMFYIVDGPVTIGKRDGSSSNNLQQRGPGEVYGEELLDWPLSNSFPGVLPLATESATAIGDVEALVLMASDLKSVVFEFESHYFFGMITCKKFSAKEVEEATKSYDSSRIIREGAAATVYKGVLSDKTEVEVKRYKVDSYYDHHYPYLVKMVAVASRINHINLVKVLGCCVESPIVALVSEYVPNDNLWKHIVQESSPLSLELRMKIALETAGALAYLRSLTTTPILPCFVSSSSILLDDNYAAKLSSSLLRFVPNSHFSWESARRGNFDPDSKTAIEKSDVYGIGVVLAELLTGKYVISSRKRDLKDLASSFPSSVEKGRLKQILEAGIKINGRDFETAKKAANLAKRCLRYEEEEMPSMKEVVEELEGLLNFMADYQHGEPSFS